LKVLNVYIIKDDGRPILNKAFGSSPIDDALISSFLAAIKAFAGEALPSERPLEAIDKGDIHILFANFKDLIGAIVVKTSNKDELHEARTVLQNTLKQIRMRYSSVLEDWNGNLSHFRELEPILEKAIKQLNLEMVEEIPDRQTLIKNAEKFYFATTNRQYKLFDSFWKNSDSFKTFCSKLGVENDKIIEFIRELMGERINLNTIYNKFEILPPKVITIIRHLCLRGILNAYTST